jgi:NAD(P)-dependent dehydrogenase (short-subunit alcohol dehydrogenase family)
VAPRLKQDPRSVILVVGGSGALGAATCECLAESGHALFLTYRSRRAEAEALVERLKEKGVRASSARLDLGDIDAIALVLDKAAKLGAPTRIVHAAGPPIPQAWVSKVTPRQWREMVSAEVEGFFNLIHLLLPRLRSFGGGSTVAATSVATSRVILGDVLSAVPKAAIEMIVHQIAREEGRFGIRANCVAPGIIDAGLGLQAQQDHYSKEVWDAQRRSIPAFSP